MSLKRKEAQMADKNDKPAEKKHKNEELVGASVLYKSNDGVIRAATITSLSPSKNFLHCSDSNIWLDPGQIVENLTPGKPEEK
jgi:hypothetical protein